MVRNLVGSPAKGSDFFDRETEQKRIWDDLHRDHLLLLAPRRVGKTSLLYKLAEEAPAKGLQAAYCSAAEAQNELGFLQALCRGIARTEPGLAALKVIAKGPASRFFGRVKKVEVLGVALELDPATAEEWSRLGDLLITALERQEQRWLLMVDELPLFVLQLVKRNPSTERARGFLTWLRNLRQVPEGGNQVRWLFAGSIGLDTVAARYNLGDAINDLHLHTLGPFQPDVADRFLASLAATHDLLLSAETRRHVLKRVGWLIPFHLQILFAALREQGGHEAAEPSRADIDAAVESLLSPANKAYFDYWRQRLTEELGRPDDGFALTLLNAAARDGRGATRETLGLALDNAIQGVEQRQAKLRDLLDILEGDGYLVEEHGRYRFRSPLLHEYWRRRALP